MNIRSTCFAALCASWFAFACAEVPAGTESGNPSAPGAHQPEPLKPAQPPGLPPLDGHPAPNATATTGSSSVAEPNIGSSEPPVSQGTPDPMAGASAPAETPQAPTETAPEATPPTAGGATGQPAVGGNTGGPGDGVSPGEVLTENEQDAGDAGAGDAGP